MKKIIIPLAIIFVCTACFSGKTFGQIKFEHGTWAEIKAKAKAENKIIFMDAFTTWCGPCKWMVKNVFTNDTVANYYNSTFVNAKIDMEAGEGKELAIQYSIQAYPSLLYIDSNGEIVHRAAGSRETADFIQLGKDALNPDKQFGVLEKKYKNGQRDIQFMKLYLASLQEAGLKTVEPLAAYFSTQKEEDLTNRDNWNIIYSYLTDFKSKQFNYLIVNSAVFSKKYSSDSVNSKMYSIYMNQCLHLIYSKEADSTGYFKFKEEITKSGFAKSEELVLDSDIGYYLKKQDYINYSKVASLYIEKYQSANSSLLNEIAYEFYTSVQDKTMLAKAEQWSKKSYELDPNPITNGDTYACLLSVNEKKKEAIKLEKYLIEIIKSDPNKYDQSSITEMENKIADWSK